MSPPMRRAAPLLAVAAVAALAAAALPLFRRLDAYVTEKEWGEIAEAYNINWDTAAREAVVWDRTANPHGLFPRQMPNMDFHINGMQVPSEPTMMVYYDLSSPLIRKPRRYPLRPVVILQPTCGQSQLTDRLAGYFIGEGHPVLVPDLRDQGLSLCESSNGFAPYNVSLLAHDVYRCAQQQHARHTRTHTHTQRRTTPTPPRRLRPPRSHARRPPPRAASCRRTPATATGRRCRGTSSAMGSAAPSR